MHLFINSLAASAGGGLTYIRNVVPVLASRPGVKITVALPVDLRSELQEFTGVEFVTADLPALRRYWYEQSSLPGIILRSGADALLSVGNFALRSSPVPQILLSRNSLYTSEDFYHDLRSRGEYRLWLDTHARAWFARRSIAWADATVAPSEAFASELRRWTGKPVQAIHHGFDYQTFARGGAALAADVEERLRAADGALKLLFVSHYNYYRNFETLFRALPLVRERLSGSKVKLLLTCDLSNEKAHAYSPRRAAQLVTELNLQEMIVELGNVPYAQLHQLYRRADIYVTPAYAETFAHPLVEAMASGLPVIASELAVHREICGDAAVYFARFSPEKLAVQISEVAASPETMRRMTQSGRERAQQFSWQKHVDGILRLAESLRRA